MSRRQIFITISGMTYIGIVVYLLAIQNILWPILHAILIPINIVVMIHANTHIARVKK